MTYRPSAAQNRREADELRRYANQAERHGQHDTAAQLRRRADALHPDTNGATR